MLADHSLDLLQAELVQPDNPGLGAEERRHYHPSFLFVGRLRYEPGAVDAVHAPPVRVGQEMGSRGEKHVHLAGTGCGFFGMRHFDEKLMHSLKIRRFTLTRK